MCQAELIPTDKQIRAATMHNGRTFLSTTAEGEGFHATADEVHATRTKEEEMVQELLNGWQKGAQGYILEVKDDNIIHLGCYVGNSCLTGIIFWGSKTVKKGFLRISFFPVFSGGIFHRNVVLEGVSGIPVFCCFHRIFLQEFLRDRNSCIYTGFLRIPPDSCSCQTLSCSGQRLK
jgi:hypothetical protein